MCQNKSEYHWKTDQPNQHIEIKEIVMIKYDEGKV